MNFHEFKLQAAQFLQKIFELIDSKGIVIEKHWNIDHLCFRVDTEENYQIYRKQFSKFSKLLIESEVNGRQISTFKFSEPIQFRDWSIGLVELPAPKKGKSTILGFEHIEIVVDIPLNDFKKLYPTCRFDEGGLHKLFNQELEISFGDLAIKFHPLSLESVINIEKNVKLFKAISDSAVLLDLKEFEPLVSGTFPLDIAVKNSDVDILIFSPNLDAMEERLKSVFSDRKSFKIERNSDRIVVQFSQFDFEFEIYAERTHSALQKSNLHFLLEERLFKIGPDDFKSQIVLLKELGTKTEAAFAKVLGLSGDPYQALLDIRKKSESELLSLLS